MIKEYYRLTKPGIIYGNGIATLSGFFLAYGHEGRYALLLFTLLGISLVIASGCVFNNYIDRDIDSLMERTKGRALVRKVIGEKKALVYGALLGILGIFVLFIFTNTRATLSALLGFIVYVVLYSLFLKRHSVHGTLIGGISGAIPPVVGYVSVTNSFDIGALLLFLLLALWQMPHSFAIALYRLEDYKKAKIPVLPVSGGTYKTKVQILVYIALFTLVSFLFTVFHLQGLLYLSIMTPLCFLWLLLSFYGFFVVKKDEAVWAKKVFRFSLIVLLAFSGLFIFA